MAGRVLFKRGIYQEPQRDRVIAGKGRPQLLVYMFATQFPRSSIHITYTISTYGHVAPVTNLMQERARQPAVKPLY